MPDQHEDTEIKLPIRRVEIGLIISLLLSAGSTIFGVGVVYGDVRDQGRRLQAVEDKMDDADDKAAIIGERLARMESNIEFLVEQYKTDRRPPRQQ